MKKSFNIPDLTSENNFEEGEDIVNMRLVLGEEQWEHFLDLLERPPRVITQIQKLFSTPPVAESKS